jgi:hypothetical protein
VSSAAAAQMIWARRRKLATMRPRWPTMERDYKPRAMAVDYHPAERGPGCPARPSLQPKGDRITASTSRSAAARTATSGLPRACRTTSSCAGSFDGFRTTLRQFDVAGNGYACGSFTLPGSKNLGQPRVRRQPRSGLGGWPLGPRIGAVPPRVHVRLVLHLAGCASQSEWPRPGPQPRVWSADPRRRLCDSRRRSSRPRPDQESPIDPTQGRARGQTTPHLARPLQNQPSRLVDGEPAREGASLPRLQATSPPAPTKTRKLCLFRRTRPRRMRRATGLQSVTG